MYFQKKYLLYKAVPLNPDDNTFYVFEKTTVLDERWPAISDGSFHEKSLDEIIRGMKTHNIELNKGDLILTVEKISLAVGNKYMKVPISHEELRGFFNKYQRQKKKKD